MPENNQKNNGKIFSNPLKIASRANLPLYIVGILVERWAEKLDPVTVSDIRKEIYALVAYNFSINAIQNALNNIPLCCPNIILSTSTVKVGSSRIPAQAFSISFKSVKLYSHGSE